MNKLRLANYTLVLISIYEFGPTNCKAALFSCVKCFVMEVLSIIAHTCVLFAALMVTF